MKCARNILRNIEDLVPIEGKVDVHLIDYGDFTGWRYVLRIQARIIAIL